MKTYITVEGDCWDSIAKNVYGSEFYADFLMKNNIEKIDIYRFPSGVELKTPEFSDKYKTSQSLPDWRV